MADSDEGVIPLSRWRAALARARRGRKADAILSEPDAAQLVPRLPVQDLYYAITEVGLADAQELVALATPEQLQGFVDLDVWERDRLDEQRIAAWMETLAESGYKDFEATSWIDRVPAYLELWYPGEAGGTARISSRRPVQRQSSSRREGRRSASRASMAAASDIRQPSRTCRSPRARVRAPVPGRRRRRCGHAPGRARGRV